MSARTVLVVDDDRDVRDIVAEVLAMDGYCVLTAENGLDALRLLQDGDVLPDLILLDMMMPVMDGWAFRAEQRKDPKIAPIPVVVFTAYGVPPNTVDSLGATAMLAKPAKLDVLLATVDRHALRPGT